MEELIESVKNLKNSGVRSTVNRRIKKFKELGKKTNNEIFKELCFCILTANFSAEKSITIQNKLDSGFFSLGGPDLTNSLRTLGHRYPETRANYIIEARKHIDYLKDVVNSFGSEHETREWIVKNVKGIGYKEASHFLRNIGFDNLAIIDFHIIDLLVRHKIIRGSKTLTKNKYLEIEAVLEKIAEGSGLNLAELDLYLWFLETGRILK